MSRFGNLEFDDAASETRQEASGIRDGDHWFAEADEAFARADFEPALRYYARVLEFDPNRVAAWTGQVRALVELGEYREAKVWADKALERFPSAPELLAAKGVALGRLGDLDTALAFSDASLEERGDTPYVWIARGDVLLARNEKRADFCFERATSLPGAGWLVHWLSARVLHHYGQFAAALKQLQVAAEVDASRFATWLLMGDCQMALGLTDSARRSWTQAQQLEPHARDLPQRFRDLDAQGWLRRGLRRFRAWARS